jgi:hypothetical protein
LGTTTLTPLDEQILRLGRVGEGHRTRTDFQGACALRAIAGELVPIDDLVLVDAGSWRTERLLRTVKLLVAEHLTEPSHLGGAPRKPANRRAREAAAAMRRASPTIALQEIQLQAMAIPSARGHLTWSLRWWLSC